jgi:Cu/Ag efflux pump CusA
MSANLMSLGELAIAIGMLTTRWSLQILGKARRIRELACAAASLLAVT